VTLLVRRATTRRGEEVLSEGSFVPEILQHHRVSEARRDSSNGTGGAVINYVGDGEPPKLPWGCRRDTSLLNPRLLTTAGRAGPLRRSKSILQQTTARFARVG